MSTAESSSPARSLGRQVSNALRAGLRGGAGDAVPQIRLGAIEGTVEITYAVVPLLDTLDKEEPAPPKELPTKTFFTGWHSCKKGAVKEEHCSGCINEKVRPVGDRSFATSEGTMCSACGEYPWCSRCWELGDELDQAKDKIRKKRTRVTRIIEAITDCEADMADHVDVENRAKEQVEEAMDRIEGCRAMVQEAGDVDREALLQELHYLYCGIVKCSETLGELAPFTFKKPCVGGSDLPALGLTTRK